MDKPYTPEELRAIELFKVERDICSIFHRYAESSDVLDMVEFGDLYQLPYWEYLNVGDVEAKRSEFMREGCLMLIMRMAGGIPGVPTDPDRRKLALCREAIHKLPEDRDRIRTLKFLALQTLDLAERGQGRHESLSDEIVMIENEIMLEYFKRMAGKLKNSSFYMPPNSEQQISFEKYVQQAEDAFRKIYDAGSGTEAAGLYNDCKESLAEAIVLARAMEQDDQVRELEKKRDKYKEIFRKQFS